MSFKWWETTGGFDIKYPRYDAYKNDHTMQIAISEQNNAILEFAKKHSLEFEPFTENWVSKNIGHPVGPIKNRFHDVTVALLK